MSTLRLVMLQLAKPGVRHVKKLFNMNLSDSESSWKFRSTVLCSITTQLALNWRKSSKKLTHTTKSTNLKPWKRKIKTLPSELLKAKSKDWLGSLLRKEKRWVLENKAKNPIKKIILQKSPIALHLQRNLTKNKKKVKLRKGDILLLKKLNSQSF